MSADFLREVADLIDRLYAIEDVHIQSVKVFDKVGGNEIGLVVWIGNEERYEFRVSA